MDRTKDFLKLIKAEFKVVPYIKCSHTCIVCYKMKWHCRIEPMMVTKKILEQQQEKTQVPTKGLKIVQCFLEACGIKCYNANNECSKTQFDFTASNI